MILDEAIKRFTSNAEYERTHGNLQGCLEFRQLTEWLKDYKRLLEQEPCEDAISRQAVLEMAYDMSEIDGEHFTEPCMVVDVEDIQKLPSVKPQESKTGHWIYTDYHTWCCSECGGNPHRGTGFVPNKDGMKMRWKYCNLCGARMIELQERSDNE